jgi:polysaccharide pyruvyl transferase WcaK-like protein
MISDRPLRLPHPLQRTPSILVLCGDHRGNLGDKAIVTATAGMLRKYLDNPRIMLAGGGDSAYWSPIGVEPIAGGLGSLPRLCALASRADLVLCGGGGLFQDDDSKVKMPYWAARIASVRPFARRMAGFSIGAGPLRHGFSKRCAAWAVAMLDSVSVRDPLAQGTLQPLTHKPVELIPDPALLLEPSAPELAAAVLETHGVPRDGRPLIGVAPRRWFHLRSQLIPHKYAFRYGLRPIPGDAECAELVGLLARMLDSIVERHGAHVVFLPTYNLAHEGDDLIAAQIAERMRPDASSLIRIDDPRLYKAVTAELALLFTARMHPAIFAAAAGTPVVGLSYNQKFDGFLELVAPGTKPLAIAEFVARGAVPETLRQIEALLGKRNLYRDAIAALQAETLRGTAAILAASGLTDAPHV